MGWIVSEPAWIVWPGSAGRLVGREVESAASGVMGSGVYTSDGTKHMIDRLHTPDALRLLDVDGTLRKRLAEASCQGLRGLSGRTERVMLWCQPRRSTAHSSAAVTSLRAYPCLCADVSLRS